MNQEVKDLVDSIVEAAGIDGEHYAPCFRDCLGDNREWVERVIEQWARKALSAEPAENEVEAGAEVIAQSPGIDAPKLPAPCWMGLSRAVLRAAAKTRAA